MQICNTFLSQFVFQASDGDWTSQVSKPAGHAALLGGRFTFMSSRGVARRSCCLVRPTVGPALVWARGMGRGSLRRAMTETLVHGDKLLLAWRRVYGSVGDESEEG